MSRRKYEICVWKIAHFGIKYFPLTIITFTVMFVLLCLNLYYLLNLFYCTNETKVNRTGIGGWIWRSMCLLLCLLLWLGLLVLWLYIIKFLRFIDNPWRAPQPDSWISRPVSKLVACTLDRPKKIETVRCTDWHLKVHSAFILTAIHIHSRRQQLQSYRRGATAT